jgi:hypothetical protein
LSCSMNNRLRNPRKLVHKGSYQKNSKAYDNNRLSKGRVCFAIRTTVPVAVLLQRSLIHSNSARFSQTIIHSALFMAKVCFTSCIRSFARHSRVQLYFVVPQALDNAANGQMRFAQRVNIFLFFYKNSIIRLITNLDYLDTCLHGDLIKSICLRKNIYEIHFSDL